MSTKRIICISLAILMILLACPLSALAANTTGTVTIKDANGTTPEAAASITDVNTAFNWVYNQANSADYTIYLNSDVTTDTPFYPTTYDSKAVKTVRFEGNNHKLTSTSTVAAFYGIGLYNLKISNLTIESKALNGMDWSPRLNTSDSYANYKASGSNPVVDTYAEFTNVTYNPVSGTAGGTIKLKGGNGEVNKGAYNIKMTDCNFTCTSADTMFMMNDAGKLNLTLIGTTLNYQGGADNNDGNAHMFALNGSDVTINASNSTNNKTVFNASNNNVRAVGGIFWLGNASGKVNKVDITLGKGVELILDGVAPKQSFIGINNVSTFNFTDNGAVYKATAAGLAKATNGISLAYFPSTFSWKAGSAAVTNNTYTNTSATADVTFTYESIDPSTNPSNVAYVMTKSGSKEYFTSLSAAVNSISKYYTGISGKTDNALWEAAGSPIVYVYKDIDVSSTIVPSWWNSGYNASTVRTLYIKGVKSGDKNPVITSTAAGALIQYNAYYNLTLEDVDLDCNGGFAIFWSGYSGGKNSAKSTTNMINCNISATGTSGEGLVFKVTGNQIADTWTENYTINMTNTNVVAEDGVNAVFLFHHGCAGTLNIDGKSTITHNMNKDAAGGDTMFMIGTPRWLRINVAEGAEFKANIKNTANAWPAYQVFNIEGTNTYPFVNAQNVERGPKAEINIEDGVKFEFNADDAYTEPCYVIDQNCKPETRSIVINVGAINVALNAKAAANGFGIVEGETYKTTDTSKKLLGYAITTADGTALYSGNVAKDTITKAVTKMTPVYIGSDSFSVVPGADIRADGIRVTTQVSKSFAESLGSAAVFGTIVAHNTYSSGNPIELEIANPAFKPLIAASLESDQTKWVEDGDNMLYRAALINVPNSASAYVTKLAFRSYVTISYADGTTSTIYTDFSETDNVRSMYDVAKTLTESDKGNAATETIINTVLAAIA